MVVLLFWGTRDTMVITFRLRFWDRSLLLRYLLLLLPLLPLPDRGTHILSSILPMFLL